jgi:hypothetical protein
MQICQEQYKLLLKGAAGKHLYRIPQQTELIPFGMNG